MPARFWGRQPPLPPQCAMRAVFDVAWDAWRATAQAENTLNWARHKEYAEGCLRAAFAAGWSARRQIDGRLPAPRTSHHLEGVSHD